jgi:hypothetical protein
MTILNPGNLVGSGRTDGAVNVAVPVGWVLESVPRDPSEGQAIWLEATGFGLAVVAAGVVVYMHGCQVTFVLAGPTTEAFRVVDWPKMSTLPTTDEEMDTVVTVAPLLPPPHPLKSKQGARTASVKQLEIFHNFISLASKVHARRKAWGRAGLILSPHESNFSAALCG